MRVAKEPSLALLNQSWRTYLGMGNTIPSNGETKSAHRQQEVLDMLLPSTDIYPGVGKQSSLKGPMFWQGREYPPGVLPSDNIIREILWELYELNFIHELQSLDRHTCHNLDLSDSTQLFDRQTLISQCFPLGSFPHVSIPSENTGLVDNDFNKRFRFVTGLVFVMNSWKGDKPSVLAGDLYNLQLSPNETRELEEIVTKYYCQLFFNYFGRAAQIPHRLFLSKS